MVVDCHLDAGQSMRPNTLVARRVGRRRLLPDVDVVAVDSDEVEPVLGIADEADLFDRIARVAVDELVDELETGVLGMVPQDDDVIESDSHQRAVETALEGAVVDRVGRCQLDGVHVVGRQVPVSVAR